MLSKLFQPITVPAAGYRIESAPLANGSIIDLDQHSMAVKTWTVLYSPFDKAEVRLETEGGRVRKFAVQYLALIDDDWTPIVRYDNAHGEGHRDRLHPDGTKDTNDLNLYDLEETFEFALRDIRLFWEDYRSEYERQRP